MADLKISQLPAATTPLAGTELVPIVQSGTTDQVTVANLTAGRAVSVASLASSGSVSATNISVNSLASIAENGDITATRSGGATGYVFFNAANTKYFGWDGSIFQLAGGGLNMPGGGLSTTTGTFSGAVSATTGTFSNPSLVGAAAPYNATTDWLTVQQNQNTITRLVIDNQNVGASAFASLGLYTSGSSWDIRAGSTAANGNRISFNAGSDAFVLSSSGNATFAGTITAAASTTAATSLNIPSGTAPTSPSNGDIWFDGTNLKMRIGGITKTFTIV